MYCCTWCWHAMFPDPQTAWVVYPNDGEKSLMAAFAHGCDRTHPLMSFVVCSKVSQACGSGWEAIWSHIGATSWHVFFTCIEHGCCVLTVLKPCFTKHTPSVERLELNEVPEYSWKFKRIVTAPVTQLSWDLTMKVAQKMFRDLLHLVIILVTKGAIMQSQILIFRCPCVAQTFLILLTQRFCFVST